MLKKEFNPGIVFSLIFVFVLTAMLVFSHWQLNRQNNRMDKIQETIVENNQSSVGIVNFINAQLDDVQP